MAHMDIESTLREMLKRFHVINPRPMLTKMRGMCRILIKKTAELEMAQHDRSRYTIAPHLLHMSVIFGTKVQGLTKVGE